MFKFICIILCCLPLTAGPKKKPHAPAAEAADIQPASPVMQTPQEISAAVQKLAQERIDGLEDIMRTNPICQFSSGATIVCSVLRTCTTKKTQEYLHILDETSDKLTAQADRLASANRGLCITRKEKMIQVSNKIKESETLITRTIKKREEIGKQTYTDEIEATKQRQALATLDDDLQKHEKKLEELASEFRSVSVMPLAKDLETNALAATAYKAVDTMLVIRTMHLFSTRLAFALYQLNIIDPKLQKKWLEGYRPNTFQQVKSVIDFYHQTLFKNFDAYFTSQRLEALATPDDLIKCVLTYYVEHRKIDEFQHFLFYAQQNNVLKAFKKYVDAIQTVCLPSFVQPEIIEEVKQALQEHGDSDITKGYLTRFDSTSPALFFNALFPQVKILSVFMSPVIARVIYMLDLPEYAAIKEKVFPPEHTKTLHHMTVWLTTELDKERARLEKPEKLAAACASQAEQLQELDAREQCAKDLEKTLTQEERKKIKKNQKKKERQREKREKEVAARELAKAEADRIKKLDEEKQDADLSYHVARKSAHKHLDYIFDMMNDQEIRQQIVELKAAGLMEEARQLRQTIKHLEASDLFCGDLSHLSVSQAQRDLHNLKKEKSRMTDDEYLTKRKNIVYNCVGDITRNTVTTQFSEVAIAYRSLLFLMIYRNILNKPKNIKKYLLAQHSNGHFMTHFQVLHCIFAHTIDDKTIGCTNDFITYLYGDPTDPNAIIAQQQFTQAREEFIAVMRDLQEKPEAPTPSLCQDYVKQISRRSLPTPDDFPPLPSSSAAAPAVPRAYSQQHDEPESATTKTEMLPENATWWRVVVCVDRHRPYDMSAWKELPVRFTATPSTLLAEVAKW